MQELTIEQNQTAEPDNEIQDVCEKITLAAEEGYATLLERLERQFSAAIAPLEAEIESLQQESASIEEMATSFERLLPARARRAQYDADGFTLTGEVEKAEEKLAEMREAEAASAAMRQRQKEIANRVEAIEEEKRHAARRVYSAWRIECQRVIRTAEHGHFITLLDGLWNESLRFESAHCPQRSLSELPMIPSGHKTDLTADVKSPEWVSGQRWYQGRTR